MKANPNFLKQHILSDKPINWLVHSRGFLHAGKSLIEAEKNKQRPSKFISTATAFYNQYNYKIAIYLLSHAIELLLKAMISAYNNSNQNPPLSEPSKYSHNARKMFNELVRVGCISEVNEHASVIDLVDTYLKWFGRYYCPQARFLDTTLNEDFIEDENGLVEFKHKLTQDTYKNLIDFYEVLAPPLDDQNLGLQHLLHYPF